MSRGLNQMEYIDDSSMHIDEPKTFSSVVNNDDILYLI